MNTRVGLLSNHWFSIVCHIVLHGVLPLLVLKSSKTSEIQWEYNILWSPMLWQTCHLTGDTMQTIHSQERDPVHRTAQRSSPHYYSIYFTFEEPWAVPTDWKSNRSYFCSTLCGIFVDSIDAKKHKELIWYICDDKVVFWYTKSSLSNLHRD